MNDIQNELLTLFSRLTADQQSDIIALIKTWVARQKPIDPVHPAAEVPFTPILQTPSFSKEWHCLNALKQVVDKHYPPKVELAYIAFHPDLNSVSTAMSRDAVKQMYMLEAAYELKRVLETDPDSDVLDEEVLKTLHQSLHNDSSEQNG